VSAMRVGIGVRCHSLVTDADPCTTAAQMEGMVQDLQLAREMQQRFEDWKRERGNAIDLDVSVTVLTTGYWPTYKAVELVLPKEMADGIQQFRVR